MLRALLLACALACAGCPAVALGLHVRGVPGPLLAKVQKLKSGCGAVVVSAHRAGARTPSGHISNHAIGRAVDLQGNPDACMRACAIGRAVCRPTIGRLSADRTSTCRTIRAAWNGGGDDQDDWFVAFVHALAGPQVIAIGDAKALDCLMAGKKCDMGFLDFPYNQAARSIGGRGSVRHAFCNGGRRALARTARSVSSKMDGQGCGLARWCRTFHMCGLALHCGIHAGWS